jgi:exosortase
MADQLFCIGSFLQNIPERAVWLSAPRDLDLHRPRIMTVSSATGPKPPSASAAPTAAGSGVRVLAVLNLVLLGALGIALSIYFWPQWRENPDLFHGLFMPLICVLLLQESRHRGVQRHPKPALLTVIAAALLAAGGLACMAAAGLFAVSLGWSPSIVGFMLAGAYACGVLSAIVSFSVEPLRIVPLNWCAFCAAALWLLVAPMPPGTYAVLTAQLQTWVTGTVISALGLLGIAARQHGNLVELARTTVGVEEACSGIRSLVSCVFAAFFLSAFLLRRPWARALLVAIAAPLAIAMNFIRSLTLTLLANEGVDIGGFWHDATGFAVLGVATAALAGIALSLESPRHLPPPSPPAPAAQEISRPALRWTLIMPTAGLLLGAALTTFFAVRTHPANSKGIPLPDLAALLPSASPGWNVATAADLSRFSGTLQTDSLIQRTYYRSVTADQFTQIAVYVAYWPPGRASVSSVAMHTPDACWPGVGWIPVASASARVAPTIAGRILPVAELRLFNSGNLSQYVWYWHLYDGEAIAQHDPRSPRELLATAWRYGFHKDGPQMFIEIASNHTWSEIANEPLLAEIFARLRSVGL